MRSETPVAVSRVSVAGCRELRTGPFGKRTEGVWDVDGRSADKLSESRGAADVDGDDANQHGVVSRLPKMWVLGRCGGDVDVQRGDGEVGGAAG